MSADPVALSAAPAPFAPVRPAPVRPALVRAEDVTALADAKHLVLLEVHRGHENRPDAPHTDTAHLLAFADLVGPSAPGAGDTPLPTVTQVEQLVATAGIGPDSTVVVTSHDNPTSATRVRWVLRWAGLADVRVLDGAPDSWPTDLTLPPPATTPATVSLGHLPTTDADGAHAAARAGRLVDARPAAAFTGGADAPGERPTGHVPGARSLPATTLLDGSTFRPDDELAALLSDLLGAHPDESPLVVQCGSGVAATVTALALEQLGHTAVLYPGSWSGWVDDPTRPVAKGADGA